MKIKISVENKSLPEFNVESFAVIDTATQVPSIRNCRNYAALECVENVMRNGGGMATYGMWKAEEVR